MGLSYHIQHTPPFKNEYVDWHPDGAWALYRISGDEIARRIGFDADGNIVRRDSWPGYIGTYRTLEDLAVAIRKLEASAR